MKYEKKYLNLIFSVLFSLIVLSGAYSLNTQKQYEISSKEWKTVNLICMLSGTVGPSSVGPVSGEELLIALDRIDRSCLINGWEKEYDRIRKEIEDPYAMISFDGFRFDTAPAFGLEMYGQTSNDIWISEDDWRLTFKNRIPLAAIPLEMDFCGTFYGITDFSLMPSFMNSRDEHKASAYFTHYFSTNIGAILSPEIGLMKAMPHKAGISGGNHYAHFAAGRFRQSIGNGHTGNLMLGDNFLYQELLKMSFHNRNFTYNWSCTHFDQQPQTGMTAPDALTGSTYLENLSFNGKHNVRIVHSYGITPLDNFNISLHFGNMIQSDSPLDLRWLNPFMFMHNWFNYAWYNKNEKIESNNHFALTFEYVPLRGWAITGQLMVDQFQLPGEQQAANPPNALGFLLNTAYSVPLKTGAVTCYMEAVYTTPALYLNEKYVDEEGNLSHENSPGAVAYDWNQEDRKSVV